MIFYTYYYNRQGNQNKQTTIHTFLHPNLQGGAGNGLCHQNIQNNEIAFNPVKLFILPSS